MSAGKKAFHCTALNKKLFLINAQEKKYVGIQIELP